MRLRLFALVAFCATLVGSVRAEEAGEVEDFDRFYLGVAAEMLLPQGGSRLHHVGGATLRGGAYLSESWAVEGAAAWLEDMAGLSASSLHHWQGWSAYGDLFGYSRFDPFLTVGVSGWLGKRGQVGPTAGLGAFYHLTDTWSLRFDATATLGLETEVEVDYTLAAGIQMSF